MDFEYFAGWHRYNREPLERLSVEEARKRHASGLAYCVAVKSEASYGTFIEVNSGYYSVNFLKESGQVFLTYGFEEAGNGKLFLKQAIYSEFDGGESEPSGITTYYFSQSGSVVIERTTKPFVRAEVRETHRDLSNNWESQPEFGRYERLLCIERGI
jgi:hypothetical protein